MQLSMCRPVRFFSGAMGGGISLVAGLNSDANDYVGMVYASRCRRPRFESHLMEKPQKKDPQTSQCKSARQFLGLSVYLQEEPVLPAEAVPEACNKQGATTAFFLI